MGSLPETAERVLDAALVSEFTVRGPGGRPITHPMLPLYDGEHVLFTSSILFSRKLAHVRDHPKVAISVTDPDACPGLDGFARVCVQGHATVLDDDLHRDWERVLPLWRAKEPVIDAFLAKRVALPLFWERAVIQVVPERVWVWPDGDTGAQPVRYEIAGVS